MIRLGRFLDEVACSIGAGLALDSRAPRLLGPIKPTSSFERAYGRGMPTHEEVPLALKRVKDGVMSGCLHEITGRADWHVERTGEARDASSRKAA